MLSEREIYTHLKSTLLLIISRDIIYYIKNERLYINHIFPTITFKTVALLPPVETKATQRAAFTTGKVIVTRCGGGLGESLIGATIFFVSCMWDADKAKT